MLQPLHFTCFSSACESLLLILNYCTKTWDTQVWKLSHSVTSDSLRPRGLCPPGSSIHGILQAGILDWVDIFFSSRSSWPRDRTEISCIAGRHFILWVTREALRHTTWASISGLLLKVLHSTFWASCVCLETHIYTHTYTYIYIQMYIYVYTCFAYLF